MIPNTLPERKYLTFGDSEELTPLSAFPYASLVRFEIVFPAGCCPKSVVLRIHSDSDASMKLFPLASGCKGAWSAEVDLRSLCDHSDSGLFFYCYDVYYPERCMTYGTDRSVDLHPCSENEKRQLLVTAPDYSTPDWLKGGILYHIFVDRFASSGRCQVKPDAVLNPDWDNAVPRFPEKNGDEFDNNEFFGGDLYGIADKLDYLSSLGVTCLYLSPIFESPTNHKYDTADYESVDSMFGGEDGLKHLLSRAKSYGIHVILDGVFNHTGADSRYFNRFGHYDSVGAYQSKTSPYYRWYTFRKFPDDYECWWNVKILPRVDSDEASYREYLFGRDGQGGVIRKWMQLGIDGWRLDVADELSPGFLEEFRSCVKQENKDAVIFGEVWEDASSKVSYGTRRAYLNGRQLDSVMNYPLRSAVIKYIRYGDADALKSCIHTIYSHYPKPSADMLMNFLGTHDTMRILTALGGADPSGKSNRELANMKMSGEERQYALQLLQLAFHIVFFMPGIPCIFYGDEAGLEGYGDPFCRRPFPWKKQEKALTSVCRRIGKLHRRFPVFRDGSVRLVACTDRYTVVLRYNRCDEALLLVLNRSSNALQFKFNTKIKIIDGLDTIGSVIVDSGAVEYCIVPDDSVLLTSVMEVKP